MRSDPLRLNFTKKAIEALQHDPQKRIVWHDEHSHGLCLRIEPNGKKSFCWFRKINGSPTFKAIGRFPDLSVENARTKAAEYNSKFARYKADEYEGDNPFEKRHDLSLTVVLEDYINKHVKNTAKKPEEAEHRLRWQFKRFIPSSWHNKKLGTIRKTDVVNLHREVGEANGRRMADMAVLQMLSIFFNFASDQLQWKGENPTVGIKKFVTKKTGQRDRFLQEDELVRFFGALKMEPSRDLQHFVIIALFTGVRKNDILSIRWEHVSFERRLLTIPDPKSSEPYICYLVDEVMDVLNQRKDNKSVWVFPSRGRTGHLTGFKQTWPKLLKRAGIENFTIHDLRRTFASWQAIKGTPIHIIGKTLGHSTDSGATAIYARLNQTPVNESTERAVKAMLTVGKKKPKS